MIKAEIKASKFGRALNAVTVLVSTAKLEFGREGVRVRTVDPSNVGAVEMTLLSNAFSDYVGEETAINMDVKRLSRIIHKIESESIVHLRYESGDPSITLEAGSYNFDLNLIDEQSVQSAKRASEIDPPSEIVLKSQVFRDAIDIASEFSDEIVLGVSEKNGEFYINSIGDTDKMAVSFDKSDEAVEKFRPKNAHTIFGLQLLSDMVTVAPPGENLKIQLGEEYPGKFSFDIANENGRVTYGLAPRMQGQ